MRRYLSILVTIGSMAAINTVPASASPAGNAPFCLKGCEVGGEGIGDCSFTSYAQCQATASGRTASCAINPYYNSAEAQPARARYSRRRY